MNRAFEPFEKFQLLGYGVGGLLPVFFVYFLDGSTLKENPFFQDEVKSRILGLWLGGLGLGVLTYLAYHFKPNSKLFGVLFSLQAIYSILFIHLLVLYTGGSKTSVFSGTYIYLVAVVGYTYKRGVNLYGAAIFVTISYLANIFYASYLTDLFNPFMGVTGEPSVNVATASTKASPQWAPEWIYFLVYVIQIITTVIFVPKQTNVK